MRWNILIDGLSTIVLGGLCGAALFPLVVHWKHPRIAEELIASAERWPRVRAYCLGIVFLFLVWFIVNNVLGLV